MRIKANGIEFNCLVEGPEGAPWVTFCNSLATDHRMWDFQAAALKGRYRLLRYDRRGHGQTPAPGRDWMIQDLARDVVGLWDALGIERSHFVGLSIGGMTGQELAIDYGDRLLSFVCADSRSDASPGSDKMWRERIAKARQGGMAGLVDETLGRWFTAAFVKWNPPVLDTVRDMIRHTSLDGYEGCGRAIMRLDLLGKLPRIKTPTLFICGADDQGTPPSGMREMNRLVAGSRYIEIAPGAHLPNIEQPEAFNHALIDFLAEG